MGFMGARLVFIMTWKNMAGFCTAVRASRDDFYKCSAIIALHLLQDNYCLKYECWKNNVGLLLHCINMNVYHSLELLQLIFEKLSLESSSCTCVIECY